MSNKAEKSIEIAEKILCCRVEFNRKIKASSVPYGNHVGIGSFVLFFVVRQGVSGRRLRRAGLHLCVVGASMVAAVGKITQAGGLEGLLIEGEPESIENFRSKAIDACRDRIVQGWFLCVVDDVGIHTHTLIFHQAQIQYT